MTQWKLLGSTAIVALIAGTAVQAQVTPEEVWQNWQELGAASGQEFTADSEARNGDTLVVSGLGFAFVDPAGEFTISGKLDEVRFRDAGDGSVEVTMSESYPIQMEGKSDDGGPVNLTILVSQPGISMTVGGSADATSYDFSAPIIGIKLDSIDGADADVVDLVAEGTMTGVAGKYLVVGAGDEMTLDSSFGAERFSVNVSANDPESDGTFKMTASLADLAGTTRGTFLGADMMADMAAALKAGFMTDASFSYGATSFDFDLMENSGPTRMTGTATGGSVSVAIDKDKLAYGIGSTGVALSLSSPDIPLPEVNVSFAETAFNFLIPVAASATPADFAILTKIVDLAVSEEIWSMIDPMGNLPHDPATVIIDTKGKARLTVDLLDEQAMAAIGDAPPGELHAIDITELRARIAGAELTGAGAFTIDNSGATTFQGMPAPTGKIDLKLTGGNQLLDKLVAMGMIPEQEAMGMRMMVSMFSNTTAGADELTSTLEFKDGGFYANGQRLQ